jgi:hypothetical protein
MDPMCALVAVLLKTHPSRHRGDVVCYVTIKEVAAMSSHLTDITAYTPVGPVIAEGRVFDAVARRDLAGTLDEIADALGITYGELRVAIDELVSIGWVSLELLAEKLVLSLPEDARIAS